MMGKTRVLYHPDAMRGSTAFFAVKKLLLVGFVLGMVACTVGHQVPLKQQHQGTEDGKDTTAFATGAVFTRWGRTVCPSDATLVYRGVMGGTEYSLEGRGNEYLCLTDQPEWGKNGTSGASPMYGVEYRSGEELFDKDNGEKLMNHNAVCAVCRSARSVQLMIPGRQSCMEEWTREYYGYLMTAGFTGATEASKNYVCIDHAPEADEAGYEEEEAADLWPVKVVCGSLPCPGYIEGKRLTCVVCSQ